MKGDQLLTRVAEFMAPVTTIVDRSKRKSRKSILAEAERQKAHTRQEQEYRKELNTNISDAYKAISYRGRIDPKRVFTNCVLNGIIYKSIMFHEHGIYMCDRSEKYRAFQTLELPLNALAELYNFLLNYNRQQ
jgi:hypothetical protein